MEEQNPWWKGKEYVKEDEDLEKWEKSRIKWIPSLKDKILLKPFSLYIIFGPRQVGKTTLLKLIIRDLLNNKVEPKSIFYFRCEKLSDFKELDEILKEYLEFRKSFGIKTSFIFLDEITYVNEWYRTIKWHLDMGNFKNDVVLLTGSLSMYVTGEIETFSGRRGYGKDLIMWPLIFRDFVKVVKPEISEKIPVLKSFSQNELENLFSRARPWINELNSIFLSYIKCGGFPLSMKDFLEKNKITEETKQAYLSWIKGDLAKLKRSETIAKRIIKAVIQKLPSPYSFHGLAKEFEIKSHRTVFEYVELFEKLYLCKVLYYLDLNKMEEIFYKERKIHLMDPFLYKLFSEWCLIKEPEESFIVESTVASHLARKFRVGYWKNGKEIDFILPERNLGIEVKWQENPKFKTVKIGKMKRLIHLTKNKFEKEKFALPVSVFLTGLEV